MANNALADRPQQGVFAGIVKRAMLQLLGAPIVPMTKPLVLSEHCQTLNAVSWKLKHHLSEPSLNVVCLFCIFRVEQVSIHTFPLEAILSAYSA